MESPQYRGSPNLTKHISQESLRIVGNNFPTILRHRMCPHKCYLYNCNPEKTCSCVQFKVMTLTDFNAASNSQSTMLSCWYWWWRDVLKEFRGDRSVSWVLIKGRADRRMIPDMMWTETRSIVVSITMLLYSLTAYIFHIVKAISRTSLNTQESLSIDVTIFNAITKRWHAN
jgi:hypothetical protein